jgi:hypothetical protein
MLGPVAFRQYQTAATQRTIQDPTTIQGRPAYHLSLNSGQSLDVDRTVIHDVADIYLDATAGLLLGVSRQSRANRIQVKYLSAFSFSDYRNVNGLLFPYQIQEYLNGNLQNTITVQSVELNAAVDPQLFRQ